MTNLHLKAPLQVAAPQEINPPESRNRIKSQLESETESQAIQKQKEMQLHAIAFQQISQGRQDLGSPVW